MTERYKEEQVTYEWVDEEGFSRHYDEVTKVYQRAFTCKPWEENLSEETVHQRLNEHVTKPGFRALFAYDQIGGVKAALWYDTPTVDQLRDERGDDLATLAQDFMTTHEDGLLVWEREVIVDPSWQGQGLASHLRASFLDNLKKRPEQAALVLTRMRSNNVRIMAVAEKFGYQKTGITMPTSQPEHYHEYWCLCVE